MSLQSAWNSYVNSCECGKSYPGYDCAHYLSNALIKGGFFELDGGEGADLRIKNGRCVCTHGRPIRAKEMQAWFASKGTKKVEQPDNEICLVYQEQRGRGHVLMKNGTASKGTGDHSLWPIQKFYII